MQLTRRSEAAIFISFVGETLCTNEPRFQNISLVAILNYEQELEKYLDFWIT